MTTMMNLTGSEKQIAWANEIRQDLIDSVESTVDYYKSKIEKYPNRTGKYNILIRANQDLLAYVLENATSANWWIDNRNGQYRNMIQWAKDHGQKIIPDELSPIVRWFSTVKFCKDKENIAQEIENSGFPPVQFRGMK